MMDHGDSDASKASEKSLLTLILRNSPFIAMLALALFGVAFTSVARQWLLIYWVVLAPIFGVMCVVTQQQDAGEGQLRWPLVQTELLHWGGVLVAMYLVFAGNVEQMMNADASALMVLTILALGTYTAGVHVRSWRIVAVGTLLALSVPLVAWLEQATLLLLLIAVVVLAVVAVVIVQYR